MFKPWLPKKICAVLGHRWRDTSFIKYKRESGIFMKREIVQRHCDRCGADELIEERPWEEEKQ